MVFIKKLRLMLDEKNERQLLLLVIFSIFISIVETIGISAIMPFIDIATNFNKIDSNYYYNKVFNFFDFNENVNFVIFFGIALFCFYVLRGLVHLIYNYVMANFIQNLYAQNTSKLFNVYLKMPYKVFTNKNSSYLTKTIITEASLVSKVFSSVLTIISESLVLIFLYILMLSVSWKITFIFTFILAVELLFITRTISKKIKKIGTLRAIIHKNLYEIINRLFGNFKQIKLQDKSRLNTINNDFYSTVNQYARVNTKNIFLTAFPRIFLETSGFSAIVLFLTGLLYFNQSNISYILPTLSLFVLALYRLLPSVNRIVSSYNALMYHNKSVEILNQSMQITQENVNNRRVKFQHNITISHLNFSYQTELLLDNINLIITKGEKIAFIGQSGSGKSTLVDLIVGLHLPTKGEIKVDNILISKSNLQNWRSQIGYITQEIYLFDGTIAENICFGRKLNKLLLKKVLEQVNMFKFIKTKSGMDTLVGEGGIQLSGGQKQRIAIARALYGKPEILVLDEATSSLDEKTERQIMNEIYEISREKTMLIVAHRLSTIKNCDKVYQIKEGLIKQVA